MDFIHTILHLDESLVLWTQNYGLFIYLILFLIIFAETGLIITPFLPGDSLLFAVGAVSAMEGSQMNPWFVWILLIGAAILGDNVNYWMGRNFGLKMIESKKIPIKKKYLHQAEDFYRVYGVRTVILARFLPILRTFAPFAAGLSRMNYKMYFSMSALGSFLWMSVFIGAGYKFGNISQVKTNFHIVILAVIAISFLPIVYKLIKSRLAPR